MDYGSHYSMVKEKSFVRKDIFDHIREGNVAISSLEDVKHLQVLWISPLDTIPQAERNPRLIYELS